MVSDLRFAGMLAKRIVDRWYDRTLVRLAELPSHGAPMQ
jgi:hypothetical protein